MSLDKLLKFWRKDPTITESVAAWQTLPAARLVRKPSRPD